MTVVAWIRRHPLWTIGVLAAALRALFIVLTHPDPLNGVDSAEYDGIARALLAGNGITTEVGFVRPPLYPAYLAVCYALGGIGVMQVTQVILGAGAVVLIGVLGRDLFADARAGWAGALIAAVYPWFFQYVATIASENLFTFLAVAAFVVILRASGSARRSGAIGAGALFGVASLARANLLVLAPGLALWWWWQARRFAPAFLFGVGVIAALVPFAAYNAAVGRGLVLASSGGGLSFYAGNNPDTARFYGGQLSDEEWRALSQVVVIGPEALRFAGCDPAAGQGACIQGVPISQVDAFWYSAGLRYIRSEPGTWAITEARKLLHYWRPWVEPRAYSMPVVIVSGVSFGALLLLAIVGLRRMSRRTVWFVLAIAIGSTVAAVAWNVQLRYRFALLDPVLIAAASLPAALLLERIQRIWRIRAMVGPPR
jgi:hypothetical protein